MQIFINGRSIDKAFLENVRNVLEAEGITSSQLDDRIVINTNTITLPLKDDISNIDIKLGFHRNSIDYLDYSDGLIYDTLIGL